MKRWFNIAFLSCVLAFSAYNRPVETQTFASLPHSIASHRQQPAQIELYDLQGRCVRSQGVGLECLNLQGLAPGQYVMKVTMADGTTFSDKVVKE